MDDSNQVSQFTAEETEPSSVNPVVTKKSKLPVYILLGMVIIIFLSVGYVLTTSYYRSNQSKVTPPITITPTVKESQARDLTHFRDEKYGFEFKIPPNYTQDRYNDHTFSNPESGNTAVSFYYEAEFLPVKENIAKPSPSSQSQVEKINGYNWQIDNITSAGKESYIYSLKTNGIIVRFSVTNKSGKEALKQIVSTFQFYQLPYERLDKVLLSLKTGDTFGPFKIAKIEPKIKSAAISADNMKVTFTGLATLRGIYGAEMYETGTKICVSSFDKTSANMLPKLDRGYDYEKRAQLCFNQADFLAKSTLKQDAGAVLLTIRNLSESFDVKEGLSLDAEIVNASE